MSGKVVRRARPVSARSASSVLQVVQPLERRMLMSLSPAAGEFRVNTYTTNQQAVPDVAMDAAGNFVIAWASTNQDGDVGGIYAQRFNSAGAAQGGEFLVNNYTSFGQGLPAVAMSDSGAFVITWEGSGAGDDGIFARLYNSAGVAQGGQFIVNSYTTGGQTRPAAAMDADGDFVIAWMGEGALDFPLTSGIYARRFDETGTAQGDQFKVNTYTRNSQLEPAVAMNGNGDFVVVWDSSGQDGDFASVHAQRFNAAGVAQGSEIQVNTYTTSQQWFPGVGMDADGDFVVAWESFGQDGDSSGIYAQRFSSSGVPVGNEFQVSTYTTSNQRDPFVAMSDGGAFVIAWESNLQDGQNLGVYARAYDASGTPEATEFRVNTYTTNSQQRVSVALDASGDAVITWHSPGDGSGDGVYARLYTQSTGGGAPSVIASGFLYQTAPQKITFTFDANASAGLGAEDILLEKIGGGAVPSLTMLPYGTEGTNVASFTMNSPLADGNYKATVLGAPGSNVLNLFILGGDANHDRKVDVLDLIVLSNSWLGTGKNWSQADFNYDGLVNQTDLGIMAQHWQQNLAAPAPPLPAVPTAVRAPVRAPTRTPTRVIDLV